jgi:nucleotide-binding universal stress UspA family protein
MNTIENTVAGPDVGLQLPRVLVVGTELTAVDQIVGTVAIRLAVMLEAAIHLVHVLDTGLGDPPTHGEPNEAVHRALAARVRQRVENARVVLEAERVRIAAIDRDGHAVVRVTLADGRPWETLVQLARELRLPWVVVGGRPGAALLGHTSDHVLRHTDVPVLIVPEGCADTLAGPVLVAVDGSERATHVLRAGGVLARALGRSLDVLHVHSAADADAPARIAERLRSVQGDAGTTRTLHLVVQKTSIAHAIAEHARAAPPSLLIVGAGGRGILPRVLGSTAASLAHTSPVPVLVVR